MDNLFTYQSMSLPDFCRMPRGTVAVFFCDWRKVTAANNRITGKFKHVSLDVHGKVNVKSYNVADPVTGEAFKMIKATVIKPVPARKQRGRKPKNLKVIYD